MARSAGSGQRWLIAAALLAPTVAQAAAPAQGVATAAASAGQEKKDKKEKMEKITSVTNAPDAALLEYLGRYGEAADGIDPLSFDAAEEAARRDDDRQGQP